MKKIIKTKYALIGVLSILLLGAVAFSMPASSKNNVEEGQLWEAVRVHWGQYANKENVTVLKADVTCDGAEDYIASRVNLDNPDGPFFEVFLVTNTGAAELHTEGYSLSYNGSGEQFGICGKPGVYETPEVFAEAWDKQDIDEIFDAPICNTPIGISDGMCDIVYFFWDNPAIPPAEENLVFFRN